MVHWMNETGWIYADKDDWIAHKQFSYKVELANKFDIHDSTWAESKSRINALRQSEHKTQSMEWK